MAKKILLPGNTTKKDKQLKGIPEVYDIEQVDISGILQQVDSLYSDMNAANKRKADDKEKRAILNKALEVISTALYADVAEMEKLTKVDNTLSFEEIPANNKSWLMAEVNFYKDAISALEQDSEAIFEALEEYVFKAKTAKKLQEIFKNQANKKKSLGELKAEFLESFKEELSARFSEQEAQEFADTVFYTLAAIQAAKQAEDEFAEDEFDLVGDEMGNAVIDMAFDRFVEEMEIDVLDAYTEGEDFTLNEFAKYAQIMLYEHLCKDETLIKLSKIRQRPYDMLKSAFVHMGDSIMNKIMLEEYENEYYYDLEDRGYWHHYHYAD